MKQILLYACSIFLFTQTATANSEKPVSNLLNSFTPKVRYVKTLWFKTHSSYLQYRLIKAFKGVDSANAFYRKQFVIEANNYIDYLPLTGGTLTGGLVGTTASFSSNVTITGNSSNTSRLTITGTDANGAQLYLNSGSTNGRNWGILSNGIAAQGELSFYDATAGASRLTILSGGNVGIGTTNPVWNLDVNGPSMGVRSANTNATNLLIKNTDIGGREWALATWGSVAGGGSLVGKLSIYDNSGGGHRMVFDPSGNVGIGTTNPLQKLDIQGAGATRIATTDITNGVTVALSAQPGAAYLYTSTNTPLNFATNNQPSQIILLTNGNVGIGTSIPSEKLSVNGNIKTKKLIVTQTGWPDYVFDPCYKLKPLSELEQFIQKNKHLPEMPSARQVEEKGISVGDNQALLLKKIEELTLYLIQQQKQIEIQANEIRSQALKIKKLQNKQL